VKTTVDAIEVLKTRHSVRAYSNQPVPREVLEDVIDCGRLAATAINIQPWEFVVVTDAATRRKLAEITDYGHFIASAPACVVVLCQATKYYLEDGCAATQNILLAARAHGLGACWVAGDKKPYVADICKIVGAPDGLRLVSLIPMGYPAENPEQPKRPLADVLHWEKY
jgi:nitroreductase